MSFSFLVLRALLHSDETTDTAAVRLINKHVHLCVCVLYRFDPCCWCRADSAWLLGVSSSKQPGCQWREERLKAKAFGICMGIIPVLGAGQGPADPRLLFLTKTIIIPLHAQPHKRACPHSLCVGRTEKASEGWWGTLFLVLSPVLGACPLGEGKVSAWLGWLAVPRGA